MTSSEENATLVSNQHSSDGEVTNNRALRDLRLKAIWDDACPSQNRFQWRSQLTLRHLRQQLARGSHSVDYALQIFPYPIRLSSAANAPKAA
jgi:hypothetical protein